MFSILNRALSWAITSFGNKFCLKKRSRLIKALDNRFYVKFMQLEIGLFKLFWKVCQKEKINIYRKLRLLEILVVLRELKKKLTFLLRDLPLSKGPVKLIKRVKIAHSFLQSVSDQFHVIIPSLPM